MLRDILQRGTLTHFPTQRGRGPGSGAGKRTMGDKRDEREADREDRGDGWEEWRGGEGNIIMRQEK